MTVENQVLKARSAASLMLRCSGAVFTGLMIVTVITMGLMVISDADEPAIKTSSYTIRFPEDEAMLKDLSKQLLKQAETDSLSSIEPASGTIEPKDGSPANAAAVPASK